VNGKAQQRFAKRKIYGVPRKTFVFIFRCWFFTPTRNARICGVCGGGCAESSLIMIGDSCTINKRSEATVSPDCGEVPGIRTFGDKRRNF